MITCRQVATLLTSGEVEQQGGWGRMEVWLHLWMCKNCSRLARQIKQIRQAGKRLRSMFESEQPAAGADELKVRLLKKLQASPPTGQQEQ